MLNNYRDTVILMNKTNAHDWDGEPTVPEIFTIVTDPGTVAVRADLWGDLPDSTIRARCHSDVRSTSCEIAAVGS